MSPKPGSLGEIARLTADLDPACIGKRRCQAKVCQWGIAAVICGAPAVTVRPRPAGHSLNATQWDVCQRHADFLDRLRANMRDHAPLLERLRDA